LGIPHRQLSWLRAAGMLAHAAKAFMRWVLVTVNLEVRPISQDDVTAEPATCVGLLMSFKCG
jgi:hypothetical protein